MRRATRMPFQVGDFVFHPAHGVGRIVRLEERRFVREQARLYYEVLTPKSTIWVPVETYEAVGLRQVTPKPDLAQYRDVLKSHPAVLEKDPYKRHRELADRLKQGSFRAVCEVVRDLTARGWRKPLNEADSTLLRKARENLCQEWATAAGVSVAEATQVVEDSLREARQAHMV